MSLSGSSFPLGDFSQASLHDFRRDGFGVVPGLVPPPHCAEILDWLETVEAQGAGIPPGFEAEFEDAPRDGVPRVRKLRRLLWNAPDFWIPLLERTGVLALGARLVGGRPAVVFHAAFMKPRRVGSEVALHQDQALWRYPYPGAVSLWLALSPATRETGCLVGAPGSHQRGEIPHARDPRYPWHASLSSAEVEAAFGPLVPIELGPGDAAFWDGYFVHGSGPNRSEQDRRGVVLVFADASAPHFQATDRYDLAPGRVIQAGAPSPATP